MLVPTNPQNISRQSTKMNFPRPSDMMAYKIEDIKSGVCEGSLASSKILAQTLKDTNVNTSARFGSEYTKGTRKWFESTRAAWCSGTKELSDRVQSELSRGIHEQFALQRSTLEKSLDDARNVLAVALEMSANNIGNLQGGMLQEVSAHFISTYKSSMEDTFDFLLESSLETSKHSLLLIIRDSLQPESLLGGTQITENIEEALSSSYQVLERMIEEEALQTVTLFHLSFISGQERLLDGLQVGLKKGLEEAGSQLATTIHNHLQFLVDVQNATFSTFMSDLERHIQHILSTGVEAMTKAHCDLFEEAGQELTTNQKARITTDVARLFKVQKRAVEATILPWTLACLEAK